MSKAPFFKCNLSANYTTTLTRAVGPTTVSGKRGTLPQPAPSDTNSVWLAKNGNDGNAGTQAAPKLTLSGAEAILSATKSTIHIFRNGYVGDLTFTISASTTIAGGAGTTNINIQVADGEVATILGDATTSRLVFNPTGGAGTIKINGLYLTGNQASGGQWIQGGANATTIQIENCLVSLTDATSTAYLVDQGITTTKILKLYYSMFMVRQSGVRVSYTTNNVFDNNIWVLQGNTGTSTDIEAILTPVQVGNAQTTTVTRNIFYALPGITGRAWRDLNNNNNANKHTLTFASSHFSGLSAVTHLFSSGANTAFFTLNINYCLNSSSAPSITADTTIDTGLVATVTNAIDPATPPLYTDEITGYEGNPEGFQLQAEGMDTPEGGMYILNSPLIAAGLAAVNVNPWDETTAFTSWSWDDEIQFLVQPKTGVRRRTAVNLQQARDLQGDLKKMYDSLRREYELDFGDNYASARTLWYIELLMSDTGTLKFYRQGEDGNEFDNGDDGTFNQSALTMVPNLTDATNTLIPHKWAGFVIEIDDSGTPRDFLITDNDETTWYLQDIFAAGLPSNGTHDFAIRYQFVKTPMEGAEASTEWYVGDQGQLESEIATDSTKAFEWQGQTLKVVEVRTLDRNRADGLY